VKALSDVLTALAPLDQAAKEWVLTTAAARVSVTLEVPNASQANPNHSPKPRGGHLGLQESPKEFLKVKRPTSDVQRVACLAYFLTKVRGVSVFGTSDISKLSTEAAAPAYNVTRALDNAARAKGYISQAGNGKKQITAFGEDIVEALPDQTQVKNVEASKPKRRSKVRKAKKKAK
jgi:hypothetical protein